MSSLSDTRSKIADYLNRNDLNSQIDTAINRAIDFYETFQFWFQQGTDTFSTVSGQESYGTGDGLPSNISDINVAQYTLSSGDFKMHRVSFDEFQLLNPSHNQGQPINYSWWNDKLYIDPVPDQAYTITLWYWKNYPDMTANDDTNDFLDHASDLIEARVMWSISSLLLRQFDVANQYKQMESEALFPLQKQTINFNSTRSLAANCW